MQELRRWPLTRLVALGVALIAILVLGVWISGYAYGTTGETSSAADETLDANLGITDSETNDDTFDPLEPTPAPTTAATEAQQSEVVVYISGAVAEPGTYAFHPDGRVDDIVRLAGGLTADADRDRINLSEHIHDAQHIHIVRRGEAGASVPASQQSQANDGLINLNTASAAELESLDGIGKVLAQRIVDWRATNGPFASPDDLRQVKGVTASIYEEIKDKITVS